MTSVDDVLSQVATVSGYLETAGWLVSWHDGHPEDNEIGYEGDHREGPFSDESYDHAEQALQDFVDALDDPNDVIVYVDSMGYEQLGHDLWLTRNGHGAGFWDRGLGALGDRLTEAARSLGEAMAYVDTDDVVHVE